MATYKTGEYAIATTNRAPLVRGQAYLITEVLPDRFVTFLRLENVPYIESAINFRPAEPGEVMDAMERAELARQLSLPLTVTAPVDELRAAVAAEPTQPVVAAPDGNPKTRLGMAKVPLALIPGPALVHMGEAFRDGAVKYGPANWRDEPVTTSTYVNAALRHILSYYDGETNAEDSGVHHLGHALGCLAIILDAEEQGTLNDDRPTAGRTASLIKEKTRPLAA